MSQTPAAPDPMTASASVVNARRQARTRKRTWPAILTLFVLAPLVGEVLSTSTPPLAFINPLTLFWEGALYGSGALLVREIARRRRLGWSNILLMGAAYGILEEAIFIQSWFNPSFPTGLGAYGRYWDTNLVWALELTAFHAVFSITVSILLAEAIFPDRSQISWLGRKECWGFTILLGGVTLLGFVYYGFSASARRGYTHPPAAIFGAISLMTGLFLAGAYARPILPHVSTRPVPSLWRVRVMGFALTLAFFAAVYSLSGLRVAAPVTLGVMAFVLVIAARLSYSWSGRAGWSEQQRLALATGALGYWLLFSLLAIATGLPVVSLLVLGLLIWLARRAAHLPTASEHYEH